MVETSDVFTPAKLPIFTDVDRSEVSGMLRKWVRRGGYFVSVLGTTKLGKTTLVRGLLSSLDAEVWWSTYLSGQSLQRGAGALWEQLARDLGIPTSRESGLANSDRETWGIFGRFNISWLPGNSAGAGANAGGDHTDETSSGEHFDIDPETAVKEVLGRLLAEGKKAVVAIDDFHFVADEEARRGIVLALRPLTDTGLAVILSTIPGGQTDPAMEQTNLGGRRKSVIVPAWETHELAKIALKGFPYLSVTADQETVDRLASESFGSPQIMQQLCLDLCENVNGLFDGEAGQPLIELRAPADWDEFFRELEDDDAFEWLKKLTKGPNPRKPRKKQVHPGPPPKDLDGYQLILLALHELGSPAEVPFVDIKQHIGSKLGLGATDLNKMALELKARNLNALASKKMRDALNAQIAIDDAPDGDESQVEDEMFAELVAAEAIPQPVFEVRGEQQHATVRVLDPLLSYAIKWHPRIIQEDGR